MSYICSLLVALFSVSAIAMEDPTALPPPGFDNDFVTADAERSDRAGRPVVDVIKEHMARAGAQEKLRASGKAYVEKRKELLKSSLRVRNEPAADKETREKQLKSVERLERQVRQLRKEWLNVVDKFGPCVASPTKKVIKEEEREEQTWFVEKGSCYFNLGERVEKKAFDVIVQSLKQFSRYQKHLASPTDPNDDGGFFSVLRFKEIDTTTGKPSGGDVIPDGDTYALIGVRGFEMGPALWSFSYFFKNTIQYPFKNLDKFPTVDGKEDFFMTFSAVDTDDFSASVSSAITNELKKPIFDMLASGRAQETSPQLLEHSGGAWYVRPGYFSYFTSADFSQIFGNASLSPIKGVLEKLAKEAAHDVLLDMLVTTIERAFPQFAETGTLSLENP